MTSLDRPMPEMILGQKAPEFSLPTDTGSRFRLGAEHGKTVVLTFYSDSATEGCAIQNSEFSALLPEFNALDAVVAAIAPQDAASGAAFRKKHKLTHILAFDSNMKVLKAYGLWAQKKLWGHEYMGVLRTTIVIDASGKIAAIIKATRIKGHAKKVLEAVRALRDA